MMRYERPTKLEDALPLLEMGDWTILAGGTDYYPGLKDREPSGNILDLSAMETLRGISLREDHWEIGALATWTDILDASLPIAFNGLKQAAREVGSVQIQNRGTVAGNVCNASPAADGVPPLLTLDAIVETVSNREKRCIPLYDFIEGNRKTKLQPDEIVSRLLIPENSAKGNSAFLKLGIRSYLVISITMVAVRLDCDDTGAIVESAISVGSCSTVAQRLTDLEENLRGTHISDDPAGKLDPAHLEGLAPIDDVRSTASYRLDASLELTRRAIEQAAEDMR